MLPARLFRSQRGYLSFQPRCLSSSSILAYSGKNPVAGIRQTGVSGQNNPRLSCKAQLHSTPESKLGKSVKISIDGELHSFSPIVLRDLDSSPHSIDPSTKQKNFSTTEISPDIEGIVEEVAEDGVSIRWNTHKPGPEANITQRISWKVLQNLAQSSDQWSQSPSERNLPRRVLWDAQSMGKLKDIDFQTYMESDTELLVALEQLHTHGLMFLTRIPDDESAVSKIAERIGPLKNTFYGPTWEVRSVPNAKNVAYTSQDLGFHMDLMYMQQPPHLQFLHCIRSSSSGGASLFTDSLNCAATLYASNPYDFTVLANTPVNYHYDHPESHLYRQSRPVFEMKPGFGYHDWVEETAYIENNVKAHQDCDSSFGVVDFIDAVSWSPPFQAPFVPSPDAAMPLLKKDIGPPRPCYPREEFIVWHEAASLFNKLIHMPDRIYERMMKPGECVIFDNRRVLHARTAFEVDDSGKERWLRGAYLDSDPYMSKMEVLRRRFSDKQ